MILDQQRALGLSPAQIESLRRIELALVRDAIRWQADLAIAYVDVEALLDGKENTAVDVAKAEAGIRQIERIRSDLSIAMVRAVQAAKAQLTPEQRVKLTALDVDGGTAPDDSPARADTASDAPRGTTHAPPAGEGSRPQAVPRSAFVRVIHDGLIPRTHCDRATPFWYEQAT